MHNNKTKNINMLCVVACLIVGSLIALCCSISAAFLLGDVNEDGTTNAMDNNTLKRVFSGHASLGDNAKLAADMDFNGIVNAIDANCLSRYLTGSYYPEQNDHKHDLTAVPETLPTCSEPGNIEYWYCSACGKYFEDASARSEISLANTVLNATGHTYATDWSYDENNHWYAATCEHMNEVKDKGAHDWDDGENISDPSVYEDGETVFTCLGCGYFKEQIIPKLPSFTVKFYDSYNKMISHNKYEINTPSDEVSIPSAPSRKGYRFDAWIDVNTEKNITEFNFATSAEDAEFQFKPSYVKTFEVAFIYYNEDGQLIKTTVLMDENHIITIDDLPKLPERKCYTSSWEGIEGTTVTSDLTFSATYKMITFTVTFLDGKGGNKLAESQVVEYGSFAIIPECEAYGFNVNGVLSGFSGWKSDETNVFVNNIENNKLTEIYSDMTLYAAYETVIDKPMIATHIIKTEATKYTVTMTLCMPSGYSLYSVNMSMDWTTEEGMYNIVSASVAKNTYLDAGECNASGTVVHMDKEKWLTYNNKTKKLDFVWGCGNGHSSFETDENIIVLNFEAKNNSEVTEEIFSILDGSTFVYGENGTGIDESIKAPVTLWFY